MGSLSDDPAQAHRADLPGVCRVGDVVLLELTGAPAGHVEEAVVDRQVDVGDQRRHRPERRERGRQTGGSAGSAGIVMTLSTSHAAFVPSRCHRHTEADRSAVEITTPTNPQVASGSCDGRISRTIWCSAPRSTLCWCTPAARSQKCRACPYFRSEQQFGDQAVLDHRGSAPLAGDQDVLVEVPPRVVGEVLRPAVGLPGALHRERVVVEQGDPARAVRVVERPADAGQEDAVGSAVQRVRAGVAGLLGQLGAGHGLHQVRRARVGLRVEHVDVRRPQARHEQVATRERGSCRGPRAAARCCTRSSRSGAARRLPAARPSRRPVRSGPTPGSTSTTAMASGSTPERSNAAT